MQYTKEEILEMDKRHLVEGIKPDYEKLKKLSYGNYETALEAAGVEVLKMDYFGSYQGDWYAKIRFPNGEIYYVHDYYGSCSGCDAFEAHFGCGEDWGTDAIADKLADFGREYLSRCVTKEQLLKHSEEHSSWDMSAEDLVKWVNAN